MKTVVLEVGHGPYRDRWGNEGHETGAQGPGTNEYTEVCVMADVAEAELIKLGYEVTVLDPAESLTRIGSMTLGADIMVSLHLNAFNGRVQGTETLIHRSGTQSDQRLASLIQREMISALGFTDRRVYRHGLAVLGSVPPSVKACCLTEAFFIDSMPDAATTRVNAEKAARAIAAGIHSYASLY